MPDPGRKLRVHVVSETEYLIQGQGVHTAFVDCVDLLQAHDDVEVVVNQRGWGDLMHAHTYGPYYFWKGRRYRGRRVYTVHVIPDSARGSLPAWKCFLPFIRWYFKRVYSYATVCIAISPMVEEAIRALHAKTHIVRIFNPIHTEKFAPTPERRALGRKLLGLPEDAFVVLGVGQLEGRKGVEDFLDVAAACPEYTFVWAGGRPFGVLTEGIAKLNRRIAGAGAHVKFPGLFELGQMSLVYNAADLLLFPSYQENCPLVPVEAAAAGLPVVYRDLREYQTLYAHPYLKVRDTGEFVALTRRLATEPSFYRAGQEISAQLLQQFEKNHIRQSLIELYRDVAAGKYAQP